jgi:hypothetical protein
MLLIFAKWIPVFSRERTSFFSFIVFNDLKFERFAWLKKLDSISVNGAWNSIESRVIWSASQCKAELDSLFKATKHGIASEVIGFRSLLQRF